MRWNEKDNDNDDDDTSKAADKVTREEARRMHSLRDEQGRDVTHRAQVVDAQRTAVGRGVGREGDGAAVGKGAADDGGDGVDDEVQRACRRREGAGT